MAVLAQEIFLSPDEVEVDRVEITSTGSGIGKDHLILSNKRLYYKGAAMSMDGSNLYAQGESILDVAHITSTNFSVLRNILLLIMGILVAAVGVYCLTQEMGIAAFFIVAIGIVFIVLYCVAATKVLLISCGAPLKIQIKGVSAGTSVTTFQRFCKNIHITAEKRRAELNK